MKKSIFFLGKKGSNSHLVALNIKKGRDILFGLKTISEIFKKIGQSDSAIGVVPLENTLTGSINLAFDLISKAKVAINGERILKIRHCLIAKEKADNKVVLKRFKFCLSHPEVFKQCAKFMRAHPQISPVPEADTATACQKLLSLDNTYCAIANKRTAEIYGLKVLTRHLEDIPLNYTRFVIIGKKMKKTGNKISLTFTLSHTPGSLVKALKPFADNSFNLTKIESRPIHGNPWEYQFFADVDIGRNFKQFGVAFKEMYKQTENVKILGRYQKGEIIND